MKKLRYALAAAGRSTRDPRVRLKTGSERHSDSTSTRTDTPRFSSVERGPARGHRGLVNGIAASASRAGSAGSGRQGRLADDCDQVSYCQIVERYLGCRFGQLHAAEALR